MKRKRKSREALRWERSARMWAEQCYPAGEFWLGTMIATAMLLVFWSFVRSDPPSLRVRFEPPPFRRPEPEKLELGMFGPYVRGYQNWCDMLEAEDRGHCL